MSFPLNALGLSHSFMTQHVPKGGFCIDATAGRGRDTLFLAELVGEEGKVLAFDVQEDAVTSTSTLLRDHGIHHAEVVLDSHSNMDCYAEKETADAIMFNFGWLPGGDHRVFTKKETSITAIENGLEILKPGGVMSLCIYYGKETGYEERDALQHFLKTVDPQRLTILFCDFINRTGEPPLVAFLLKTQ